MTGADKFIAIALVIVAFLMLVVWLLTPPSQWPPDVEEAFTDPAYAPYGADLLDRADHVPCAWGLCKHSTGELVSLIGEHCRSCAQPYPCPHSAPFAQPADWTEHTR